ncbi:MAG: endonuclease/exonuclease/phosphatase family protein, partial [Pseudomonadota bacterium]
MADCSNTPTPESTANFDLDSRCFSEAMTSNADYTTARASDGNVKKTFAAALREAGWEHVGEWSTNPLVTESNQVIPYAGTNQLFRPLSMPYQVDSAANPDPNALVGTELVDVSKFVGYDEIGDFSAYVAENLNGMISGETSLGNLVTPKVGHVWIVDGSCWERISLGNDIANFKRKLKEYETEDVQYSARQLAIDIRDSEETKIKLVTWNIWGGGARLNYGDGSYANRDYLREVKKNYLSIKPEYIGFQETYTDPTTGSSDYGIYPFSNSYFSLANDFGTNLLYGNTTISSREITESSTVVYSDPPGSGDNEYRSYSRVVVNVGTTPVAVYNTHLSFVQSRRATMIAELLSAVQSETLQRVVVMGDFNAGYAELLGFESEGFTIANKDEFNTNNKGSTWYIDNIMYKGFSSLIDKGVVDVPEEVADHKPLFTELEL